MCHLNKYSPNTQISNVALILTATAQITHVAPRGVY